MTFFELHPWFVLFTTALATWGIIEIWHHSLLFASLRARTELSQGWLSSLLGCPFCLTPWVSIVLLTLALVANWPRQGTGIVLVCIFAIGRLANLGNDLTHHVCRTPDYSRLPEEDVETADSLSGKEIDA